MVEVRSGPHGVWILVAVAAIAPFDLAIEPLGAFGVSTRAVVLAGTMLSLLVAIWLPRSGWRPGPFELVVGAWLAGIVVSLVAAGASRGELVFSLLRYPLAAVIMVTARAIATQPGGRERLLRGTAVGAAVAAAFGIVLWGTGSTGVFDSILLGEPTRFGVHRRLTHPWSHANIAAMALACGLGAVVALRTMQARVGATLLLLIAGVLTLSRGWLLAVLGVGMCLVALATPERRSVALRFVGGGLAMIVLAVLLVPGWNARLRAESPTPIHHVSFTSEQLVTLGPSPDLIELGIANNGSTTWQRSGADAVLISARWFADDGYIWAEDHWALPEDIAPAQTITTGLTIVPRVPDGRYRLRWDLLLPQRSYFAQFAGMEPTWTSVVVTGSAVEQDDVARYQLVEHRRDAPRSALWRAAIDNITDRPFVGVGADRFGAANVERFEAAGDRSGRHAHSLYLEPLASWGLIGAVPFFVLVIGGLARALRAAHRSREALRTGIAVGLVAIGVHGLVDWPLVMPSTIIPVSVLIGLAWADPDAGDHGGDYLREPSRRRLDGTAVRTETPDELTERSQ